MSAGDVQRDTWYATFVSLLAAPTETSAKALVALVAEIEADIGRDYRLRNMIQEVVAETQPYELPKRRYQTDVQRRVAICPRCRQREVEAGRAEEATSDVS